MPQVHIQTSLYKYGLFERLFYFPAILSESKLQPANSHWQHFKTKDVRKENELYAVSCRLADVSSIRQGREANSRVDGPSMITASCRCRDTSFRGV